MQNNNEKPKTRPYWHLDAKWLCGLILIPIFTIAFLAINLYLLTNKTNGVKVIAVITSSMFSPGDEVNKDEMTAIRETIKKSPDKAFRPFPGIDAKVTEADLDKYSPKEIKQRLFAQLAENIYNYDSSKFKSPEGKSDPLSTLGMMAVLTKDGHDAIGRIALIFSSITLIFLLLLVLFSYGFGRIISPGLIFLIIGLPSSLFLLALQKAPQNAPAGTADVSMIQRGSFLVKEAGPMISSIVLSNYVILAAVGLLLILVGIVGRIILKIKINKIGQ